MTDERKDLPPVNSPNFLAKLREAMQTYLGNRGATLDRGVTLRDLTESGLVTLRANFGKGSSNPIGGPGSLILESIPTSSSGTGAVYEPDLTPPPVPTGFAATAAISNLLVECDPQTYTQGHGHAKSKLYGATWTSGPLPVFADAVVITEFSGTVASHATNPATTWHLWLTWVSVDDVESPPAGGTNGVVATTGQDVALLLEALTGEITASALHTSLGTRIDLIDTPTTGLSAQLAAANASIDAINTTLADIASTPAYDNATTYALDAIVSYNGGLYQAKGATTGNLPTNTTYWAKIGDYTSLGDAVAGHAAILSDHETRVANTETGLAAEVSDRSTLATQVRGGYAGTDVTALTTGLIYSERQARSTADATEVTARQALSTKMVGAIDPTGKTLANVTSGLIFDERTTRSTETGALATRASALEASVNNATTGLATKASVTQVATAKAEAIAASASVTDTISARLDTGDFAAVQIQSSASASAVTGLQAQYTVKLDVGGKVSGYGLASTGPTGTGSTFAIRADRFYIAPPSGSAVTTDIIPFAVQATATTVNGVAVPAGVYINDTYIKNGTITNAKIGNAQIDDAKVASLSAAKLTAGSIAVGQYIQGTGYVAGSSGWRINGDGTAEFSNGTFRGNIYATAGYLRGLDIEDSAGNVILSSGSTLQDQVSSSANLLANSDLTLSSGSWIINWLQDGVQNASIARNLAGDDWRPIGGNTIGIVRGGTPTGVWDMRNTSNIPVIPGQRYEVSGLLACHRCNAQLTVGWYNAAGTYITENAGPLCTTAYSGGKSLTGYFQGAFFVTAPAGSVYAVFWVRGIATGESNPYMWLTQGMFCKAAPNQTTPSKWSPSNFAEKINSGNVSTYIDGAAIGNAQINGNIYSENYYPSGGTAGWLLDRAGNFTANSGTFAGNVVGAQFTTGAYTGYAWPAVNNYGTYLGPSGLLIGNANNNKYLQITQDGNIYAPQFSIVNGAATFGGTLTASAVNAVNTINIAGNAVTVSNSSSGNGSASTNITVPSGVTAKVTAIVTAAGVSIVTTYAYYTFAVNFNGNKYYLTVAPTMYQDGSGYISSCWPSAAYSKVISVTGPATVSVSATGAVGVSLTTTLLASFR